MIVDALPVDAFEEGDSKDPKEEEEQNEEYKEVDQLGYGVLHGVNGDL